MSHDTFVQIRENLPRLIDQSHTIMSNSLIDKPYAIGIVVLTERLMELVLVPVEFSKSFHTSLVNDDNYAH